MTGIPVTIIGNFRQYFKYINVIFPIFFLSVLNNNVQSYQIWYKNQFNITCVHVLVHFVILDSLIYRQSCDLDK